MTRRPPIHSGPARDRRGPVGSAAVLMGLAGLNVPVQGQNRPEVMNEFEFDCRSQATAAYYEPARLWPGGIIPYTFDPNVTPANQLKARAAMDAIEAVCNARFVPRAGEANYVEVLADTTSYSEWIGMMGGRQRVGIFAWNARFVIVHELMHALGAWHENQRPDRDAYITINFANIEPGQEYNFTTRPSAVPAFWYDFESVMHYRRFHFSGNGHPTIDVSPAHSRWKHRIGQINRLSTGDIWMLTEMYGGPRPPGVFDLQLPAQNTAVGGAWSPSFAWTPAALATGYRLVVDDDPAFASPEIDTTTAATSFAGGTLQAGRVYYWTVYAQNSGGSTQPWHTPVGSFYTGPAVPGMLYVDAAGPAGGDGHAWASAFQDLQDAIALAACAGSAPVEVRIAAGTYRPDRGTGDRLASFILRSGLTLAGGYGGVLAIDPDERNIGGFPTVLSGDLAGDDLPGFTNISDNSQHVLFAAGQRSGPVVLDGVMVSGGNADGQFIPTGQGGALWADDCQVLLRNCWFTDCLATADGGAVRLQACDGVIDSCTFLRNLVLPPVGVRGGGLSIDLGWGSVELRDCWFADNQSPRGAAAFVRCNSAQVSRTAFEHNQASVNGGGFMVVAGTAQLDACSFIANSAAGGTSGGLLVDSFGSMLSSAAASNCLFHGNSAPVGGGAVYVGGGSSAALVNCTIAQNSAASGGGIYAVGQYIPPSGPATPTSMNVTNSIIRLNTAQQVFVGAVAAGSVSYSNIQGGWAGPGNINSDPLFASPGTGSFVLLPGSPCIDAGNNPALAAGITQDLLGQARFLDDPGSLNSGVAGGSGGPAIVDMGAYEFQGLTCYANCDRSTIGPVLNILDFNCFLNRFAGGEAYANCDQSTVSPILNILDFNCFLNKFAAGCP
jgi:predicted outer membrane repeat protein